MAGSTQDLASFDDFTLWESCQSHGEIENFVWQIERNMSPEWYENPTPDNHVPLIVAFDAKKKILYVNLEMCKRFGVEVDITPEYEEKNEI